MKQLAMSNKKTRRQIHIAHLERKIMKGLERALSLKDSRVGEAWFDSAWEVRMAMQHYNEWCKANHHSKCFSQKEIEGIVDQLIYEPSTWNQVTGEYYALQSFGF